VEVVLAKAGCHGRLRIFYLARVVFVYDSLALDTWASGVVDGWRAAEPNLTRPVRFVTFFAALRFYCNLAGVLLLRARTQPPAQLGITGSHGR
jgi:hypothetical protein